MGASDAISSLKKTPATPAGASASAPPAPSPGASAALHGLRRTTPPEAPPAAPPPSPTPIPAPGSHPAAHRPKPPAPVAKPKSHGFQVPEFSPLSADTFVGPPSPAMQAEEQDAQVREMQRTVEQAKGAPLEVDSWTGAAPQPLENASAKKPDGTDYVYKGTPESAYALHLYQTIQAGREAQQRLQNGESWDPVRDSISSGLNGIASGLGPVFDAVDAYIPRDEDAVKRSADALAYLRDFTEPGLLDIQNPEEVYRLTAGEFSQGRPLDVATTRAMHQLWVYYMNNHLDPAADGETRSRTSRKAAEWAGRTLLTLRSYGDIPVDTSKIPNTEPEFNATWGDVLTDPHKVLDQARQGMSAKAERLPGGDSVRSETPIDFLMRMDFLPESVGMSWLDALQEGRVPEPGEIFRSEYQGRMLSTDVMENDFLQQQLSSSDEGERAKAWTTLLTAMALDLESPTSSGLVGMVLKSPKYGKVAGEALNILREEMRAAKVKDESQIMALARKLSPRLETLPKDAEVVRTGEKVRNWNPEIQSPLLREAEQRVDQAEESAAARKLAEKQASKTQDFFDESRPATTDAVGDSLGMDEGYRREYLNRVQDNLGEDEDVKAFLSGVQDSSGRSPVESLLGTGRVSYFVERLQELAKQADLRLKAVDAQLRPLLEQRKAWWKEAKAQRIPYESFVQGQIAQEHKAWKEAIAPLLKDYKAAAHDLASTQSMIEGARKYEENYAGASEFERVRMGEQLRSPQPLESYFKKPSAPREIVPERDPFVGMGPKTPKAYQDLAAGEPKDILSSEQISDAERQEVAKNLLAAAGVQLDPGVKNPLTQLRRIQELDPQKIQAAIDKTTGDLDKLYADNPWLSSSVQAAPVTSQPDALEVQAAADAMNAALSPDATPEERQEGEYITSLALAIGGKTWQQILPDVARWQREMRYGSPATWTFALHGEYYASPGASLRGFKRELLPPRVADKIWGRYQARAKYAWERYIGDGYDFSSDFSNYVGMARNEDYDEEALWRGMQERKYPAGSPPAPSVQAWFRSQLMRYGASESGLSHEHILSNDLVWVHDPQATRQVLKEDGAEDLWVPGNRRLEEGEKVRSVYVHPRTEARYAEGKGGTLLTKSNTTWYAPTPVSEKTGFFAKVSKVNGDGTVELEVLQFERPGSPRHTETGIVVTGRGHLLEFMERGREQVERGVKDTSLPAMDAYPVSRRRLAGNRGIPGVKYSMNDAVFQDFAPPVRHTFEDFTWGLDDLVDVSAEDYRRMQESGRLAANEREGAVPLPREAMWESRRGDPVSWVRRNGEKIEEEGRNGRDLLRALSNDKDMKKGKGRSKHFSDIRNFLKKAHQYKTTRDMRDLTSGEVQRLYQEAVDAFPSVPEDTVRSDVDDYLYAFSHGFAFENVESHPGLSALEYKGLDFNRFSNAPDPYVDEYRVRFPSSGSSPGDVFLGNLFYDSLSEEERADLDKLRTGSLSSTAANQRLGQKAREAWKEFKERKDAFVLAKKESLPFLEARDAALNPPLSGRFQERLTEAYQEERASRNKGWGRKSFWPKSRIEKVRDALSAGKLEDLTREERTFALQNPTMFEPLVRDRHLAGMRRLLSSRGLDALTPAEERALKAVFPKDIRSRYHLPDQAEELLRLAHQHGLESLSDEEYRILQHTEPKKLADLEKEQPAGRAGMPSSSSSTKAPWIQRVVDSVDIGKIIQDYDRDAEQGIQGPLAQIDSLHQQGLIDDETCAALRFVLTSLPPSIAEDLILRFTDLPKDLSGLHSLVNVEDNDLPEISRFYSAIILQKPKNKEAAAKTVLFLSHEVGHAVFKRLPKGMAEEIKGLYQKSRDSRGLKGWLHGIYGKAPVKFEEWFAWQFSEYLTHGRWKKNPDSLLRRVFDYVSEKVHQFVTKAYNFGPWKEADPGIKDFVDQLLDGKLEDTVAKIFPTDPSLRSQGKTARSDYLSFREKLLEEKRAKEKNAVDSALRALQDMDEEDARAAATAEAPPEASPPPEKPASKKIRSLKGKKKEAPPAPPPVETPPEPKETPPAVSSAPSPETRVPGKDDWKVTLREKGLRDQLAAQHRRLHKLLDDKLRVDSVWEDFSRDLEDKGQELSTFNAETGYRNNLAMEEGPRPGNTLGPRTPVEVAVNQHLRRELDRIASPRLAQAFVTVAQHLAEGLAAKAHAEGSEIVTADHYLKPLLDLHADPANPGDFNFGLMAEKMGLEPDSVISALQTLDLTQVPVSSRSAFEVAQEEARTFQAVADPKDVSLAEDLLLSGPQVGGEEGVASSGRRLPWLSREGRVPGRGSAVGLDAKVQARENLRTQRAQAGSALLRVKSVVQTARDLYNPAIETLEATVYPAAKNLLRDLDAANAHVNEILTRASKEIEGTERSSRLLVERVQETMPNAGRSWRESVLGNTLSLDLSTVAARAYVDPTKSLPNPDADKKLLAFFRHALDQHETLPEIRDGLLALTRELFPSEQMFDEPVGDLVLAKIFATQAQQHEFLKELFGLGGVLDAEHQNLAALWATGQVGADRGAELVMMGLESPETFRRQVGAEEKGVQGVERERQAPFVQLSVAQNKEGRVADFNQARLTLGKPSVPYAVQKRLLAQILEGISVTDPQAQRILTDGQVAWKKVLTSGLFIPSPSYALANKFGDPLAILDRMGFLKTARVEAYVALRELLSVPGVAHLRAAIESRFPGVAHAFDNFLAASAFNPELLKVMAGEGYYVTHDGRKYENAGLLQIARRMGVNDAFQSTELARQARAYQTRSSGWGGRVWRLLHGVSDVPTEVAQKISEARRFGAFLVAIESGMEPQAAGKMVAEALIDYKHNLHPLERSLWLDIIFPFYNFMKGNSRRLVNLAMNPEFMSRPGKSAMLVRDAVRLWNAASDPRDEFQFNTDEMPQDVRAKYALLQDWLRKNNITRGSLQSMLTRGTWGGTVQTPSPAGGDVHPYQSPYDQFEAKGREIFGPDFDNFLSDYYMPDPSRLGLPDYWSEREVTWSANMKAARGDRFKNGKIESPGTWNATALPGNPDFDATLLLFRTAMVGVRSAQILRDLARDPEEAPTEADIRQALRAVQAWSGNALDRSIVGRFAQTALSQQGLENPRGPQVSEDVAALLPEGWTYTTHEEVRNLDGSTTEVETVRVNPEIAVALDFASVAGNVPANWILHEASRIPGATARDRNVELARFFLGVVSNSATDTPGKAADAQVTQDLAHIQQERDLPVPQETAAQQGSTRQEVEQLLASAGDDRIRSAIRQKMDVRLAKVQMGNLQGLSPLLLGYARMCLVESGMKESTADALTPSEVLVDYRRLTPVPR